MTNEELLLPRFEVVADYPESFFKIGQVIQQEEVDEGQLLYDMDFFLRYSHLFRKMGWWEKRDIKDMPEYVKCIYGETSLDYQQVYKSISWGLFKDEGRNFGNEGDPFANIEILNDTRTHDKGEIVTIHAKWLSPATKDEYLIQNNPKKVEI